MADPLQYWTPEFTDVYIAELNRDPDFQKASRKFSGVLVMRALDAPEGKDVEARYHVDRGRVTVETDRQDAPSTDIRNRVFDKSRMFARTTAPYPMWCKLDRGDMNVVQAIVHPDYKVEGPKLKIVANMAMLNAMAAVAKRLPKKY
jgi:putative sterol carrier protein